MVVTLLVLGTLLGLSPATSASAPGPAAVSSRALEGDELLAIGDLHKLQRHFQEALPYYQRAVETYRVRHDRRGEAAALMKVGDVLTRLGRQAEAVTPLQQAVSLWRVLGQEGRQAQALLTLGLAMEAGGRRGEAHQAYEQAQRLFRLAKDPRGVTESLIRLGTLTIADNQREEGLGFLHEALADARRRRDTGQHVAAATAIGKVLMEDGDWAGARLLFDEGLRLVEAERNLRGEAELRTHLAKLEGLERRFPEGVDHAQRALLLYQTLRDRSGEADVRSILGWLHYTAGNVPVAIDYHQYALALYRALHDVPREAASLLNLAAAYEAQGLAHEAQASRAEALSLLQSSH